jgi:hypothetical protein
VKTKLFAVLAVLACIAVGVTIDNTAVAVTVIITLGIVQIVAVAQAQATERNADNAAALARRPLLDVDELAHALLAAQATHVDADRAKAVERLLELQDQAPSH